MTTAEPTDAAARTVEDRDDRSSVSSTSAVSSARAPALPSRVTVTVLLVLGACEPSRTPLRWLSDTSSARWWYLVPVWTLALAVGLAEGRGLRRARRAPVGWLLGAMLWTMLVSPFGLLPDVDLAVAAGLTAFVLAGAAIVEAGGWSTIRACVFPASSVLMVASALTEVFESDGERWSGVFRDPNTLGFACVVAVLVGIDRAMRHAGRGGLVLAIGAMPVLLLTDGRVAIVALAAGSIVLLRPMLPRWVLPTMFVVVAIGATALLVDDQLGERASRSLSRSGDTREISTLTGRTAIWEVAVDEIGGHPLTGVGAGSTSEVYRWEAPGERINYAEVTHGHDLWVQLALSGGMPAVGFVAVGVVGYIRRAVRRPVRDRDALMLALLVHGLTEDVVAEPRWTLILAAAAFASTAGGSRRRTSASRIDHATQMA